MRLLRLKDVGRPTGSGLRKARVGPLAGFRGVGACFVSRKLRSIYNYSILANTILFYYGGSNGGYR